MCALVSKFVEPDEELADEFFEFTLCRIEPGFNKMKTRFLILITFATMLKYAIIVAGGSGTRMGGNLPKQFLLLNKKPVLYYTIRTFLQAFDDLEVILVLPQAYMDMGQEMVNAWFKKGRIRITQGGDTRFQSVKNGLHLVGEESIIFVHDGVRCLLSTSLIHACYDKAMETGSAIPVVASKDSVRLITAEGNEVADRSKVMLVQTPQTFLSKILIPAFDVDYDDKFTDEAIVVEASGQKVSLVQGEETNIKITTPLDLVIAENLLAKR
jgi:2-C-methyl-D-erythritol 4-phosphate cytidylyltransferase